MGQVLDIIDRKTAWGWIRQQYLPSGCICPACGTAVTGTRALASFAAMERTYCKSCGSVFQAKAAVRILKGTEWQPEEFVKLLLLELAGMPPVKIAGMLGKSVSCVRTMQDRCRIIEPGPHTLPGHDIQG